MACACRAAPLRIFIRSIADVQVPQTRTCSPTLTAAVRRLTSYQANMLKTRSLSAAYVTQRHFHQSIQRLDHDSEFGQQDNGQAWAPTWVPPRFRPRWDPNTPDPRQKKVARQKLRIAAQTKANSAKKSPKRSRAAAKRSTVSSATNSKSAGINSADAKPEPTLKTQPVQPLASEPKAVKTTASMHKLLDSTPAPTIRPKGKLKSRQGLREEGKPASQFDMSADDAHLDRLTEAILRASKAEKLTIGWAPTSPEEAKAKARERRKEINGSREGDDNAAEDRHDAEREQDERKKIPLWKSQKEALKKKFPEGWNPRRKLSPDAMEGIRALHAQFPDEYTTPVLASKFEVSPEAIRRILRSKWKPTEKEATDRAERWVKRGQRIWTQWSALGTKVPKKWREQGIKLDTMQTGHSGSYKAPTDTYVGLESHTEQEERQEKEAWKTTEESAPPSAARRLAASMM